MRLELARPRTRTQSLDRFEYENSAEARRRCRADRCESLRPAINRQHHAEPIPQPPITGPGRTNHPITHPPRRSPTVHPAHHPVIAPLDKSPEVACDSHRDTSPSHLKFDAPYRGGACSVRCLRPAPFIRRRLNSRPLLHQSLAPTSTTSAAVSPRSATPPTTSCKIESRSANAPP